MLKVLTTWAGDHYHVFLIVWSTFVFLTLMTGALLILRRFAARARPDQIIDDLDKQKLATEIHDEVLRLVDLRDRLWPGFAGHDVGAQRTATLAEGLGAVSGTSPGIDDAEKSRLVHQIQTLEAKIQDLSSQAATAVAAVGSGGASAEIQAQLKIKESELEQAKQHRFALEKRISEIEAALAEYELFEEDLSDVKRYKTENEELRRKLKGPDAGGSTVAVAAAVASSAGVIAQSSQQVKSKQVQPDENDRILSSASPTEPNMDLDHDAKRDEPGMGLGGVVTSESPTEPDLGALLDSNRERPLQEPRVNTGTQTISSDAELDNLFSKLEAHTLTSDKTDIFEDNSTQAGSEIAVSAPYASEHIPSDPTFDATEENAEALVESMDGDSENADQLVAEFEKLLKEDVGGSRS